MNTSTNLDQYLTYKDIAKRLSRSTNTIKRWAAINYLGFPSPRYLGRTAVFREVDIVAWVKTQLCNVSPDATTQTRVRGALAATRPAV
ncbi:MAG: putative DNA-binding transcriptional regulator AlpA [Oleispira sp.]|jgi:predicted DNA-binding transcriptional regulator AlpA